MRTNPLQQFATVRIEGSILPADLLQRVAAGDARLEGLRPEDYHLAGEKLNEAANHAWNRLLPAWEGFKAEADRLAPGDDGLAFTLKRWLLPFWKTLEYGQLDPARPVEIDGKSYPISHVRYSCPIHLVSFRRDLDRRVETSQGKLPSPHGMVQELLNRSGAHLWAFVSNGLKLRILRDNIRLTRQAFVEFDLQAMFDGRAYSDFALLWRLCHESRVNAEKPEQCWLEKWSKTAQRQGLRALDQLRGGVEKAVEAMGRGFLLPANAVLAGKLRSGTLSAHDYYRQLLRLVYRLLFLFVAEDRELLFDPQAGEAARDRYARFYSTARLRRLAERLRGTQHADLSRALGLVLTRLGTTGSPELGLPALGGIFDPAGTPDLTGCRMANADLLDAVRALAVVSDGQSLRPVDYRNLGAEELGSVYESLLELHPRFDPTAGTFALNAAAGNERKTTGSYYTPSDLITCLLDSALDPVLGEAARKPDPEAAILALKVCDPACGSGHFLIAAAHRVARRLAAVRTHEEEPAPDAVRHALRDVIGRCIHGVDINPMAVELCKVALWMDALEPGKPLSFLDHHVQCGNSMLGATPALLAKGIPDEAFEPIEGDDKGYCREWKTKNKDQRQGQVLLFDEAPPWDRLGNLGAAMAAIDGMPDDTHQQVRAKEEQYQELCAEGHYRKYGGLLADLWCAAFVWPKTKAFDYPVTERIFRQVEHRPSDITPWMYDEVRRLASQYQFLHWHLAFPGVFRYPGKSEKPDNELTGWCGGFDVVLGNPPWERIKLQEQEWFAAHGRPDIAGARTAAVRGKMIQELATGDPALHRAFLDDRRAAEGESRIVRQSGGYPLCGCGDVNTYSLFAELNRNLISPTGRVGCIVPTGIATDDTTKAFFQDLVEKRSLAALFDFENRNGIFEDVHRSYKFALLVLNGSQRPVPTAALVFFALDVADLQDPAKRFTLWPTDFALLNPNTLTCPVFRSARDAELTKAIYRRVPVLIRESNPPSNSWGIQLRQGLFHLTNDLSAKILVEHRDLIARPDAGEWTVPLYEGKLVHQFCHRFASYLNTDEGDETVELDLSTVPPTQAVLYRYFTQPSTLIQRIPDDYRRQWFLSYRDIARVTDARTCIAAVVPRVGIAYTLRVIVRLASSSQETCCLCALLNSFVFDYVTRQALAGTHLSDYIFKQLPILPPSTYAQPSSWSPSETLAAWMLPRVVELTYTAWDLQPFAADCGFDGPPFRWGDERRFQLRCELDAAYFHLYLGTGDWQPAQGESAADLARLKEMFPTPRHAVEHVMDTFPLVRKTDEERYGNYRTKERILELYDELASGRPFVSSLTPTSTVLDEDEPEYGPPLDLFGEPTDLPTAGELVVQAFINVRDGWSSEYVVCNPDYERRFHDRVKELAPWLKPADANLMLWNARRSRKLIHLPPSRPYSPSKDLASYDFVCEWAYRHLIADLRQAGHGYRSTTLERILCIPEWREQFDELVTRIKPGFSPLDYRWVATRVRKRSGKQGQAVPSLFDEVLPVAEAPSKLPDSPGVYLIRSAANEQLYTGWTPNLREQANRLVDTGQGAIIPGWLLTGHAPAETVAFQPLPAGTKDSVLHDLWRANLYKGRPVLNLLEEAG
jgi:hypothetical protein